MPVSGPDAAVRSASPAASIRAFVAGATGYTGRGVVRELTRMGAVPIAHVRPDSRTLAAWRGRFAELGATVDTTPWEEDALRERLTVLRPTHVFALLGTTRARGRDSSRASRIDDSYEAVDYGLTAMLLRASVRSGAEPRFVYLSAAGAREATSNEYLRVRGRIERELRESGLPHVIARPSFITGPDRDESRTAERLAAMGVDMVAKLLDRVGAPGFGHRFRSISGGALAASLVQLALDPGSDRRTVEREEL